MKKQKNTALDCHPCGIPVKPVVRSKIVVVKLKFYYNQTNANLCKKLLFVTGALGSIDVVQSNAGERQSRSRFGY